MANWNNLIGSLIVAAIGIVAPIFVLAESPVEPTVERTKVRLDELTMQRGYTVQLEEFALGIPPNVYTEAAPVWVREKNTYPELPEYLAAVSPVYVYQVDVAEPAYHDNPVWLSYSYQTDPQHNRSLYYYDGVTEEWASLPTWLDTVNDEVRSAWHFPYSLIVVADDTRYDIGPIQADTYTAFGTTNAAAAIAIDDATGAVLYEQNSDEVRSIASLTKLMTAYVILQEGVYMAPLVTYSSGYDQIGARLRVSDGDVLSMEDLLYSMTVGSANNAAYALVGEAGYSLTEFVGLMNQAATDLGLEHTTFADPSGLDVNNTSTARDYAKFMRAIMRDPEMLALTAAPGYAFTTRNTGAGHAFDNTNKLMQTSDLYITGSKTGYLDEAVYCLALKAKEDNNEVITVVLGAPYSSTRFNESERLMEWAFNAHDWQ